MTTAAVREAERLLAEAGVPAIVTAGGHDRSVAVISAAPEAWPGLLGAAGAELARRIRELGFGYVAIDLAGNHETIDEQT